MGEGEDSRLVAVFLTVRLWSIFGEPVQSGDCRCLR
jgi:hypothetical protein